jgi:DNA (cytosine-5)-methyltransferase 1
MRFGSVCSGIEAASVAWHPFGWEAAWLSEIEPFPCAVLKHHYPDVPNYGDMTLLPDRILSGEVEAPDLFCGGTPCQAFSVAGLRNSLDDARGNLSLTFVGIANAIDHVRSVRRDAPAIIFWENVPGVLNTKDNAFGCFLGALAGESEPIIAPGDKWSNAGCVYGPQRTVAWRVLDAQYFGVAQRRRRVFVVASAREDFDPTEVLFESEGVRRDTAPSREAGQRVAPCVTNGPPFSRTGNERVEAEAMVVADCGVQLSGPLSARDYKDAGTDGMNKISAKMVPVIHETVGALCADSHPGAYSGQDAYTGRLIPQAIPLNTMTMQGRPSDKGRMGSGIGEPGDPCPTLTKGHSHAVAQPMVLMDQGGSVMNVEHDMVGTLRRETHGHEPVVMQAIGTDCFNGNITGDIACTMGTMGSSVNASGPTVMQSMAVRRLTPTECERLQGFPDGYTNIPWRKASEAPDGPRYKALGNSWAVPVVRWIGKRIQERITT